ncbi:NUDIX domain-containing protein [Eisenibacter elegans]|jgi:8-oxo-dGTP diphosphatase|uniref:NUDIX domain-containing protein n=1 Tax=Eisenibacter elegans TaxID=997 RepID=UPI00054D9649|nr:NUDIX hydrolase [Eisenibacter elegans]
MKVSAEIAQITAAFGKQLRVRVSGICVVAGELLLVKHTHIGRGGYLWAPPGGGMQYGEPATQALQREFLEETGLEVGVGSLLFVNEYLEAPLHAMELFFEVHITGGALTQGQDPELGAEAQIIREVAFMPWEALKAEPPYCLHSRLRQSNTLAEFGQSTGYFFANS